jgi:site-specific recombinase XerD
MIMTADNSRRQNQHPYRSLPPNEWPAADRKAREKAYRPGIRLKPGGSASHFAEASLRDFTTRYGAYLGFLQRRGILDCKCKAAAQVTPSNVTAYIEELQERKVSSVTIWNCIYKLRRMSQLLDPNRDLRWLIEMESEAALVMTPRSKFDRLVLTTRLVESGLTLIAGAKQLKSRFDRARTIRNGLMIVILALTQIRLKNFVALEIGSSFKEVNGSWWVNVPVGSTKNRRWIKKRIPNAFNHAIELYLKEARPLLMKTQGLDNSLWISSRTGRRFTYKNLGTLISKITFRTLGVDVSPHLFRTAAASTAAAKIPEFPHLASALLGHADPRIADEYYKRTTSLNAGNIYTDLVQEYLSS